MKTNPIPASLYQFLTGKSPYRIDRKRDPIKIIFNNNSGPNNRDCLLYTSPSPRDRQKSRMPSSA